MTKHSTLVLAVALAGVVGCGAGVSDSQGVHPELDDGSMVKHSTMDPDVNEQIENNDHGALFSELYQGSKGQGSRGYYDVPGGWSPWLAPNPDGGETTPTFIFFGTITRIEGYEEPGYGLVNLRLQAKDNQGSFYLHWTTGNFRGYFRSAGFSADDRAVGVVVKEQYGYGLIDAMLLTNRNTGWWLTGNPDQNEYHWAYCARNYELGGIQVKEQSGYGIVNLRIYCKPI